MPPLIVAAACTSSKEMFAFLAVDTHFRTWIHGKKISGIEWRTESSNNYVLEINSTTDRVFLPPVPNSAKQVEISSAMWKRVAESAKEAAAAYKREHGKSSPIPDNVEEMCVV